MVLEVLDMAQKGLLNPVKQNSKEHTYAKMLKKEMGNIDFNASAEEIERFIRGLDPWPCAFTHIHGKTLKIWGADVISEDSAKSDGVADDFAMSGTVTAVGKSNIVVKTGNGYLAITSLQLEGKKKWKQELS